MCYNVNYPSSEQRNTFLQTPQTQLWLTGEMTDFWTFLHCKNKSWCWLIIQPWALHQHTFSQLKTDWITNLHRNIREAKGAKPFIQKHQNVFQCFQFWSLSLAACFPDMLLIFFTRWCVLEAVTPFFCKSSQPITFPEGWFDWVLLETRTANTEKLNSWFQVRVQTAQILMFTATC